MTRGDLNKLINYWLEGANDDWNMHKSLAKSKHYGPSLFYLHLSMEKLIKALIVQRTKDQAPFNHNLAFLIGKLDLDISEDTLDDLVRISEFNIATRYPVDIQKFYKTATKEYVAQWHQKAEKIRLRLISVSNQNSKRS